MKKSIILILAAALIVGVFVGCAPQREEEGLPLDPNRSDEEVFLEIKAVIQEVNERSLLVAPIEGLDYIDTIYLLISDETIINVTEGAPLEPGTIIYAKTSMAIMESYPPQVALVQITRTEIDPTITAQPAQGDTQLAPENYLTGKVISIDGEAYTLDVLSSGTYEGQLLLVIPTQILDKDMPIEPGYLIGVYIAQNDENPAVAEKIVFSEPDAIIQLDDRETISGYFDGMFPQAVYYMIDENIEAQAGVMFAIGLEQNCESGWTMTPATGVELVAGGQSEPCEDGSYFNYFGISIAATGEYTIEFINETADGTFDFSFAVSVE